MDPKELRKLLAKIPPAEAKELLDLLGQIEEEKLLTTARTDFMSFVKLMWPEFIEGHHHRIMARVFENIAVGKERRTTISMPPRHPVWVGHKVTLASGRRIDVGDVKVGDRIVSHTGTARTVKAVHEKGELTSLRIQTLSGRILFAHRTHPFLTPRGWVDARNLDIQEPLYLVGKPKVGLDEGRLSDAFLAGLLFVYGSIDGGAVVLDLDAGNAELYSAAASACANVGAVLRRHDDAHTFRVVGSMPWLRSRDVPDFVMEGGEQTAKAFVGAFDNAPRVVDKSRERLQDVAHVFLRAGRRTTLRAEGDKFVLIPGSRIADWDRDLVVDPIVSIMPGGTHEMRCFTIETDESFTIDDVAVHNTKSEFGSILLPAWYLGRFPTRKVIQASHTAELAVNFGRKVKNLVASDTYKKLFPGVAISQDSKAAGRWATNKGGEYLAIGAGGALAGYGADLLVIDDPVSEQEALTAGIKGEVYDKLFEWYTSGPLQRLQPGGAILIIACVAEGERVYSERGLVAIEKLKPGDKVWGYKDGLPTKGSVTAVIDQGFDDILSIESSIGPVHVNARHPFLRVCGGLEVRYGIATALDRLSGVNRKEWNPEGRWWMEWTKASDIQPGDVLVSPRNLEGLEIERVPTLPNPYAGRPINEDDMFVLGAVMGRKSAWKHGELLLTKPRAKNNWARFEDALLRSLTGRFEDCGDSIAIPNHLVRDWFGKLGVDSTFDGRRLPGWIWAAPHSFRRAFAEGALLTGGNVKNQREGLRKGKGVRFEGMNCEGLLYDIRKLCSTVGISWTEHTKELIGTSYRYRCNFKFVDDSGAQMTARFPGRDETSLKHWNFLRVNKVSKAGEARVYDLTVDDTENFIVEGYVTHNTRWHKKDLIGRVTSPGYSDKFNEIKLPAILESGRSLWQEYWPIEELLAKKAGMPALQWAAQYMQDPTAEAAAIISRGDFKVWPGEDPPVCEGVIMSADTAFGTSEKSNYSAFVVGGIFALKQARKYNPDIPEDTQETGVILLDAFRGRWDFPDLKRVSREMYERWEPEMFVIERRASGQSLIDELRMAGLPVKEYIPARGGGPSENIGGKTMRLHSVADFFKSGRVWVPGGKKWAEDVVDEIAEFPRGDNDDFVDATTQMLITLRQNRVIGTDQDEEWKESEREYRGSGRLY